MEYKENVKKMIDDNTNQAQEIIQQKIEIWSNHVVFSGLWWFGVVLSIIPWLIWIKYRKKDSTDRILYAGFYVIIVSLCLDVVGDQFGFWHYRFNVMPVLPTYFPWDITLMPISVMFILQIKPAFNPVIKAILFALFSAYIAEPFFHWMGVYVLTGWKYSYSFPIQIIIYLIAHYLSRRERFSPFYIKK
ncbi:CBO0543 family protein [Neobacillus sp. DY30]|uniref:CBO0543 family protein n=1 Tax=Neobacillus sp. DY30 TaxID=3047871 RepID=UPI0024BFE080|nr:CBO0543 family protein [Neobacillus sp. DY30]WHY02544.1 CBO0543 family protein [Neobacillus sp. DY30]